MVGELAPRSNMLQNVSFLWSPLKTSSLIGDSVRWSEQHTQPAVYVASEIQKGQTSRLLFPSR